MMFDALPNEIISEVFLIANSCVADEPTQRLFLIHLSHVCRRWRILALSLPWLWTRISYDYTPCAISETVVNSSATFRSRLDRLSEWLRRSGSQPVDISLFAGRNTGMNNSARVWIWDLVKPHLGRCVSLTVCFRASDSDPTHRTVAPGPSVELTADTDLSHLQTLRIACDNRSAIGVQLFLELCSAKHKPSSQRSPQGLVDLSIHHLFTYSEPRIDAFNLQGLQKLSVRSDGLSILLLPVLSQCHNLKDLHITLVEHPHDLRNTAARRGFSTPVCIDSLRSVQLFNMDTHLFAALINAPNLNRLVVLCDKSASYDTWNSASTGRGFVTLADRYGSLRSLSIQNVDGARPMYPRAPMIEPIFSGYDGLENLEFVSADAGISIAKRLTAEEDFLPHLGSFRLFKDGTDEANWMTVEQVENLLSRRAELVVYTDGSSLLATKVEVEDLREEFGSRFRWEPRAYAHPVFDTISV